MSVKQGKKKPLKDAGALQKALVTQKLVIGALSGVLAIGGIGAGIAYNQGWLGRDLKQQEQTSQVSADIDPDAGEWDGTTPMPPKEDSQAQSITLPGYPEIYIPAGATEVDVAFSNPEKNPCYFTYQLELKDSGEILYQSKQVPPGEAITRISLSRALDAGEYEGVLKVATASVVDLTPMNGANMETKLKVE